MRHALAALAAGLLFGLGLTVSQMANPAKVLGFLDLAGDWDPSLAFVLAGAVATAALGFRLVQRAGRPLLAPAFRLPTATRIDRPLLLGAAIFGLGWGLVGFCPGPALAALGLDGLPVSSSSWPCSRACCCTGCSRPDRRRTRRSRLCVPAESRLPGLHFDRKFLFCFYPPPLCDGRSLTSCIGRNAVSPPPAPTSPLCEPALTFCVRLFSIFDVWTIPP